MKVDFKRFKKVSSTPHSTVLEHPDGHTITIAHAPLNNKTLGELKSLPVKKMSGGGSIEDESAKDTAPPEPNKKNAAEMQKGATKGGTSLDEGLTNIKKGLGFAEGGVPEASSDEESQPEPQAQSVPELMGDAPQQTPAMEEPQAAAAPTMPPGEAVVSQAAAAAPMQQPTAAPQAQQAAPAPAQPTPRTAMAPAHRVAAPSNAPSPNAGDSAYYDPKNVKTALAAEDLAWQHALATAQVTPETYGSLFAKKDTLGKIGMIFGTMLGAVGSGGHGNAYLQMMNKEIERDFQAQTQTKLGAQNYLRLSQQDQMNKAQIGQLVKQGGLTDAQAKGVASETEARSYALAQAKMLQASYQHLVDTTQKMPEGAQKEQAKMVLGMIYSKVGERINNINDQAAGASAYSGVLFGHSGETMNDEQAFQKQQQGLRMMGTPQAELRANDNEAKHFPGLGQASIPLSGGDRDQLNNGMTFQNQLSRFINWTKIHSGDLSPSDIKEGRALAAGLQGSYRQATHGGVYKSGEQDFISKIIDDDPTKFFNEVRVLPSLKAVQSDSAAQLNQLAKSKGFPGYQAPQGEPQDKMQQYTPQQQSFIKKAQETLQSNPNNAAAKAVLKKLGIQ